MGCTPVAETLPEPHSAPQLAVVRKHTATRPTPIHIEPGAAWLMDTVYSTADPVPAATLIRAQSPKAVRYTFNPTPNPLVQLPGGNGTLKSYLDIITHHANWAYTASEYGLTVSDVETRYFDIPTLNMSLDGEMVLRGLSGTQEGGIKNKATITSKPHQDLLTQLEPFRDQDKVSLTLSVERGQLRASAPPDTMRDIALMVKEHNYRAQRRVSLEFAIYSIDVSNTKERAVDVSLLRDAAISAAMQPNAAILGTGINSGVLSFAVTDNSRWTGTTAAMKWLNEQGSTSIKLHRIVEPLLNHLVTLENRRIQPYVSKISRENAEVGGTTTSLPTVETEELTTGIALNFVATTYADKIHLRLSYSQAELVRTEDYSFDNGAIAGTLPISEDVNELIPFVIRNGETRIITNMARSTRSDKNTTTPVLPWIGDAKIDNQRTTETVLVVTARLLD